MKFTIPASALFASLATAAAPTTRHFYTTDYNGEYSPSLGYGLRVTVGNGLRNQVAGSVPLYRCRNAQFDNSFLTQDPNCEGAGGFALEGGVTFVYASYQPDTYEMRRLVNNQGDHVYWLYDPQTGAGPSGYLACDLGYYAYENIIAGYLPKTASDQTITLYSFRMGCNSDRDNCCN